MKYYKGNAPCLGCGKTASESPRLSKDSLCFSCSDALSLGVKVKKSRSQQTDLISDVHISMSCLRYQSTGERADVTVALRGLLESVSENEKLANCGSRYIGNFDHADERNCFRVNLRVESSDHLESFAQALKNYSDAVYDSGVKHGSNLLLRLGDGELTPDSFVKRVDGDVSF